MFSKNQVQMKECYRKAVSGARVASTIRYLVNGRGLQFDYARSLT